MTKTVVMECLRPASHSAKGFTWSTSLTPFNHPLEKVSLDPFHRLGDGGPGTKSTRLFVQPVRGRAGTRIQAWLWGAKLLPPQALLPGI